MILTPQPKPIVQGHPVTRQAPQNQKVMYPWLPAILDRDTLSAIATLESRERDFAISSGRNQNQYLHALYLKAMTVLGHSHFQPRDLPRQFRLRIIEQLNLDETFARIFTINRSEKSRIKGI